MLERRRMLLGSGGGTYPKDGLMLEYLFNTNSEDFYKINTGSNQDFVASTQLSFESSVYSRSNDAPLGLSSSLYLGNCGWSTNNENYSGFQNSVWSFSVWVKIDSEFWNKNCRISVFGTGDDYWYISHSSNEYIMRAYNDIIRTTERNQIAPYISTWNHYICVNNTQGSYLYINNSLITQQNRYTGWYNWANFGIGASASEYSEESVFLANYAALRVYDRVLTEAEMAQLYNNGKGI